MQYVYEGWLLDAMRGDCAFLKSVGIEPCVIGGPRPEPLPLRFPGEPRVRLTKKDIELLKACGVAWEPEPAVQLPLNFCGSQEAVQEIIRLRRSK